MSATPPTESRKHAETRGPRKLCGDLVYTLRNLRIAEKISGIAAMLVVVMTLLVVMSIQSVRLQAQYERALATSATAAINIGRVNALIYAIVMESRGIYMSANGTTAKPYADELLRRNRELAAVVGEWKRTVAPDDQAEFAVFAQRLLQFIDFRNELVRRAITINPAAGRAWGDNDANRALRSQLNRDLEAFAKVCDERATLAAELADRTRLASWYLALLGLSGLLLAALNVFVVRRSVITPLSDIAKATDSISAGMTEIDIPHVGLVDEIGHLARAVRNFRDATCRNRELEQLGIGTAQQRDSAMGQRDRMNDKYLETRWQLHAALDNMTQGVVMMNSKAKILMTNARFRTMYQLPPEIIGPETTLRDVLKYRAEKGLFLGDVEKFVAEILDRAAKGKPSVHEISLADGRVCRVSEQPMDGGGWVSTHEDVTEQRRSQRILGRTEQFLATIIEAIPEAIVAKDARSLRYVFVNRAAEKLIGKSRADVMGKTAREVFSAETADLIERRDRQLMAQGEHGAIVDTIDTPNNGRRTVAVRRLQIADQTGESHIFLSMIEDRTEQTKVSEIAA